MSKEMTKSEILDVYKEQVRAGWSIQASLRGLTELSDWLKQQPDDQPKAISKAGKPKPTKHE